MKPKFRLRLKDNISNTEAGNCKQKVMKLHPDTEARPKVVKALRVAKEEELSRTFELAMQRRSGISVDFRQWKKFLTKGKPSKSFWQRF